LGEGGQGGTIDLQSIAKRKFKKITKNKQKRGKSGKSFSLGKEELQKHWVLERTRELRPNSWT
jgi:hypothetical protein